ncbi:hypothetical protein P154DRAFT_577050 [Amniculicola lignicola CBS 123094]|uniref:Uncharacterized protein n=1 Tax=Amniculicola lignicola CBS 123094 TaxID=1392246 RepID=A0A6A5WEY1_9PLEO|nr:hypothetical protein P154DRAFT_577050 [Amniculicola lignicola CBS 123094]
MSTSWKATQGRVTKKIALADLARAGLPREIRDQIYREFWDKEYIEKINTRLPRLLQGWHHQLKTSDIRGLVQMIMEAGPIGTEAIEWLYENSTTLMVQFTDFYTFLSNGIFESGVTPMTHKMRGFALKVSVHNNIYPCLKELAEVQVKQGFHFRLIIDIGYTGPDSLMRVRVVETVESIKPEIIALQMRGFKINVAVQISSTIYAIDEVVTGEDGEWREGFARICRQRDTIGYGTRWAGSYSWLRTR